MKSQHITLPKVSEIKRQWFEVDASTKAMGRVASDIAIRRLLVEERLPSSISTRLRVRS